MGGRGLYLCESELGIRSVPL